MLSQPQRKFPNVAREHHYLRLLGSNLQRDLLCNPMAGDAINHCLRFVLKGSFGQRFLDFCVNLRSTLPSVCGPPTFYRCSYGGLGSARTEPGWTRSDY
jgi:hypothetical protein